jgi:hypothetical protein
MAMKRLIALALLFTASQAYAGGVSVSPGHATFGGASVSVSAGHTTVSVGHWGTGAAAIGVGNPTATAFGFSMGKNTAIGIATTGAAGITGMGASIGVGIGNVASGATATP